MFAFYHYNLATIRTFLIVRVHTNVIKKCQTNYHKCVSAIVCGYKNINLDEYHETKFNGFLRSM